MNSSYQSSLETKHECFINCISKLKVQQGSIKVLFRLQILIFFFYVYLSSIKKFLMTANNLCEFYLSAYNKYDSKSDFIFTKTGDEYNGISRNFLTTKIESLIDYFSKAGLKKDDKIAIISENRVEWVITDIAAVFLGIITVPIYNTLSKEQIKYILENSESKICFVAGSLMLDRVLQCKEELQTLERVVSYSDFHEMERPEEIEFFSELVSHDKKAEPDFKNLKQLSENINSEDLLTIIYTSGTTGVPKGVMLTHRNVCSNLKSCQKILEISPKDKFLSFLPYAHIYERVAGYYLALITGAKIYYAQNIDTIAVQMPEVKPTLMITVPRLLDKMYNKVMKAGIEDSKGFKKMIFGWAVKTADSHRTKKSSLKWKIADTLVYKKIKAKTGGQIRCFVSGGGALNKQVGEFFEGVGIQVLEGYGMTETSPVISVNRPDKNRYGTVGIPLEGVQVDIASDGEILVKGELVMKGYYKLPEETESTIKNGWLHTGDIGEFDDDGFLKITDRKKSLFKTSGGKYIAPVQVEETISRLIWVDQVIAIGNERMYVSALIVPLKDELINFAKKNNISLNDYKELLQDKELLKLLHKQINSTQINLSSHEKVKRFTLIENPFTIETGEMTPTMKIKRKVVEEKYNELIEGMYDKI